MRSTRTKRVTTTIAASCAIALAGSALSAGPVNAQYPSDSPQARIITLSKKGVPYKCKSTNSVVNDAIGGPQRFLVDGSAKFKGSFKPGTRIKVRGVHLTLVMPKKLVKKVRRDLGVRRVRGSADVKFDVKGNKGTDKMKVTGLRSGWKKLPRNKKLRIPTTGEADPYKIPNGTKRLSLLAPKKFKIHAHLRPPAVGIVKKTDLNCKFVGKGRSLGKFPV
ncbi:MAG: DUF6801 domain-containing protein [Nocardioidaceae bacterium]